MAKQNVRTDRQGRSPVKRTAIKPAITPPMSQQVYRVLRDMLIAGALRPGESVSLRTLASRLGTSPMPVREAVNRLIAEQALRMLPNRQVIVPRMTLRKFRELRRIRQMIEGMAASAACEGADNDLIEELKDLDRLLLIAMKADDTVAVLERNRDFHFRLYQAARSEILMPMIEGLWMQVGPFLYLSLSKQKANWTGTHHAALLQALSERNCEAVVEAIHSDIGDTADLLTQIAVFDE